MSKEGGDDRFRRFAFDERHTKRTIGVGQAEQNRQLKTVSAVYYSGRKQTEKPVRIRARPYQHGAGITPEDGRRCKQESGLVEDVRFKRLGGQFAPFGDDRL
jgi:hypothetical protein